MKKRYTYILLVLVLVIWGGIFYQIFLGSDATETTGPVSKVQAHVKAGIKSKDTLLLSYRDPFFAEENIQKKEEPLGAITLVSGEPERMPVDWSVFRYTGVIHNLKDKQKVTLMKVNGIDIMLKEGETYQEMKLVRNAGEFITIYYEGEFNDLHKQL